MNAMLLPPAAIVSGVAGAAALTAAHQFLRGSVTGAPRMDVLGRRAIAKTLASAGVTPPAGQRLQAVELGGDMVANSGYYALVGLVPPKRAPLVGLLLGVAAGVGGVLLPEPMGLGSKPSSRQPVTRAMTVGLYALGGLVAGLCAKAMSDR